MTAAEAEVDKGAAEAVARPLARSLLKQFSATSARSSASVSWKRGKWLD